MWPAVILRRDLGEQKKKKVVPRYGFLDKVDSAVVKKQQEADWRVEYVT